VCPCRTLDQVNQKVLKAAQPPGRFKEFAAKMRQVAANG